MRIGQREFGVVGQVVIQLGQKTPFRAVIQDGRPPGHAAQVLAAEEHICFGTDGAKDRPFPFPLIQIRVIAQGFGRGGELLVLLPVELGGGFHALLSPVVVPRSPHVVVVEIGFGDHLVFDIFRAVNIPAPVVLAARAHARLGIPVPFVARGPGHDVDDRIVGLAVFRVVPAGQDFHFLNGRRVGYDKTRLREIVPHIHAVDHVRCVDAEPAPNGVANPHPGLEFYGLFHRVGPTQLQFLGGHGLLARGQVDLHGRTHGHHQNLISLKCLLAQLKIELCGLIDLHAYTCLRDLCISHHRRLHFHDAGRHIEDKVRAIDVGCRAQAGADHDDICTGQHLAGLGVFNHACDLSGGTCKRLRYREKGKHTEQIHSLHASTPCV